MPVPVTTPVALTRTAPAPLLTALIPIALPVTAAAVIVRFPPEVASASIPVPDGAPVAATGPLALTLTTFRLRPTALIPATLPVTVATLIVRAPALALAAASTPIPPVPVPVTSPAAETLTAPDPLPTALMPVALPVTSDVAVMVRAPRLPLETRP